MGLSCLPAGVVDGGVGLRGGGGCGGGAEGCGRPEGVGVGARLLPFTEADLALLWGGERKPQVKQETQLYILGIQAPRTTWTENHPTGGPEAALDCHASPQRQDVTANSNNHLPNVF